MNGISYPLIRHFLIRPLLPEIMQQRFRIDELIRGRIIQSLSKQNTYVLHTNGVNLIARSRLPLFEGDRIIGKVLKNQPQIELKLIEVNGHHVSQSLKMSGDEINYIQVLLSENQFGSKCNLEIYPDKNRSEQTRDSDEPETIHLIVNSPSLRHIVIDMSYSRRSLSGKVWVEDDGLFKFLDGKRLDIEQSLLDASIDEADLSILAMQKEIGFFRKEWTGIGDLDIRV